METMDTIILIERMALGRVDRENSIIRNVKVLGLESRNGRIYLPEGVKAAVPLYEGARVNVSHPPKNNPNAPREYGDRIGALENVTFNNGLFADFKINPEHALAKQLLWDAENAPHNVGLSHHAEGRVAKQKVNGKIVIEAILSVTSVDLVADPATTSGLFESLSSEPLDPRSYAEKLRNPDYVSPEHIAKFVERLTGRRPKSRGQGGQASSASQAGCRRHRAGRQRSHHSFRLQAGCRGSSPGARGRSALPPRPRVPPPG